MLEKNIELVITVSGLGSNGEGISKLDGDVIFIPYTLPGEKVRVKILKVKKNIAFAKCLEVLTPADERVRPKCEVFEKCGGCQLQHYKYNSQLKYKSKLVSDCLNKIAGINADVTQTVKSDFSYGYRNKLQLPVGVNNFGETVIGFYAEASHRIIPIRSCKIHPDWSKDIIEIFSDYIQKFNIIGYDEVTSSGILREIVVREINGKFIICIVVTNENISGLDYLLSLLVAKFKYLSLYMNINNVNTNVIFSQKFINIYGESKFSADELGIRYLAGPETFIQINSDIRRKLYDKVIKLACEEENVVIDAFSGGGLLTAMLANNCKKAYGIELVKEAVDCANELAEYNNLQNKITNICGKVEDNIKSLMSSLLGEKITVVLDPPRKGCDLKIISTLLETQPYKIVYISCNPATLARDVGLLCGTLVHNGKEIIKNQATTNDNYYNIEYTQPFDMFPQTKHIETLVCLRTKASSVFNSSLSPLPGTGNLK